MVDSRMSAISVGCFIVDYEVTGGSWVRFPADASNHKPNLFHWGLTIEFRDIGSPTVTFVLSNGSARFRSEDTYKFDRFELMGFLVNAYSFCLPIATAALQESLNHKV